MTIPRPAAVVVLAAGEGTRMRSATPKVLHPLGGRTLVEHVLTTARAVSPERVAVVVRHGRDLVVDHIGTVDPLALVVDQDDVPGTGRAVQVALAALDAEQELVGSVVVLAGDVPLLDPATIAELLVSHHCDGNAVTVLTTHLPDATGYGRIVRAPETGDVLEIVEERDADDSQRLITEVNTSIYVFDASVLRTALGGLDRDNAQGEVYLTDVLSVARKSGGSVRALPTTDRMSVQGVNDRAQLAELGAELNRRVLISWMRAGVTIIDPGTTWVDVDVDLAADVTILPGTQLLGVTSVAAGATVGPDSTLRNVEIGARATVVRTHGSDSVIGEGATVGPFAYLRPGTILGATGKIGTFVETKNSTIGAGAKVPHLSYIGDTDIGEGTNVGAASVTVNYDGQKKYRTVIGAHARLGSDNMFIAPVTVGDGAYTGAGAVIRHDVPAGALAYSENSQRVIAGWVQENRPGTTAADAAEQADATAEEAQEL